MFRQLSDDQSMLMMAQWLWANVKELIIRSSDVLCYKIEPDILFHFIEHHYTADAGNIFETLEIKKSSIIFNLKTILFMVRYYST